MPTSSLFCGAARAAPCGGRAHRSDATSGRPRRRDSARRSLTFAPMSTALRTSRRSITGSISAQRDSHPSARVAKRTGSEGTGWYTPCGKRSIRKRIWSIALSTRWRLSTLRSACGAVRCRRRTPLSVACWPATTGGERKRLSRTPSRVPTSSRTVMLQAGGEPWISANPRKQTIAQATIHRRPTRNPAISDGTRKTRTSGCRAPSSRSKMTTRRTAKTSETAAAGMADRRACLLSECAGTSGSTCRTVTVETGVGQEIDPW